MGPDATVLALLLPAACQRHAPRASREANVAKQRTVLPAFERQLKHALAFLFESLLDEPRLLSRARDQERFAPDAAWSEREHLLLEIAYDATALIDAAPRNEALGHEQELRFLRRQRTSTAHDQTLAAHDAE